MSGVGEEVRCVAGYQIISEAMLEDGPVAVCSTLRHILDVCEDLGVEPVGELRLQVVRPIPIPIPWRLDDGTEVVLNDPVVHWSLVL